jgi:hypothetical protein
MHVCPLQRLQRSRLSQGRWGEPERLKAGPKTLEATKPGAVSAEGTLPGLTPQTLPLQLREKQ